MFSHLTDWELTIYGFVIAIFTIAPLPLFPERLAVCASNRHPQPKPIFHLSQLEVAISDEASTPFDDHHPIYRLCRGEESPKVHRWGGCQQLGLR